VFHWGSIPFVVVLSILGPRSLNSPGVFVSFLEIVEAELKVESSAFRAAVEVREVVHRLRGFDDLEAIQALHECEADFLRFVIIHFDPFLFESCEDFERRADLQWNNAIPEAFNSVCPILYPMSHSTH
jgi:hypothetical protein